MVLEHAIECRFNCISGICHSDLSVINDSYNHSIIDLLEDWQVIPVDFFPQSPTEFCESQQFLIAYKILGLMTFMQDNFIKKNVQTQLQILDLSKRW